MKAEYIITIDGDPDIMGGYEVKDRQELIRCANCINKECEDRMGLIVCDIDGFHHPKDWYCAGGAKKMITDKMKDIINGLSCIAGIGASCNNCTHGKNNHCKQNCAVNAIKLLEEQQQEIAKAYKQGYENGRRDEAGLRDGRIIQTFSPD